MGQVTVIYLPAEQMDRLSTELTRPWDGRSDIKLASVDHVVFRLSGTIE